MKTCDNCYWKGWVDKFCGYATERPEEDTCEEHKPLCETCKTTSADYKLGSQYYCSACAIKETVTECIQVTHYYYDGEHIGTDDDIDDVIDRICYHQSIQFEILE